MKNIHDAVCPICGAKQESVITTIPGAAGLRAARQSGEADTRHRRRTHQQTPEQLPRLRTRAQVPQEAVPRVAAQAAKQAPLEASAAPRRAPQTRPLPPPGPADEQPRRSIRKGRSIQPLVQQDKKPRGSTAPSESAEDPSAPTEAFAKARSMPPADGYRPPAGEKPLRPVRRYEYQAIGPVMRGYDNFNWVRLCVISFICIVILTVGIYSFLSRSSAGQFWLASIGRDASVEAYHQLGRRHMVEGSISSAVIALEIAQSKDTENLEVLIDLGKAYMGNNQVDSAELAYTRAIQFWPAYSEPYQHVIDIMLDQDRNYEALQLVALAMEKTEDEYFATLYNRLMPSMPSVSELGARFDKEITITLRAEEDVELYYTLFGEDPILEGILYAGEEILLEDNTAYRLRAIAKRDGMYSQELVQTYSINKPAPDTPKATLGPGKYSQGTTVSIRAEKGATIYYTVDGTTPTLESRVFENPIPLRIGKTKLRAIAVNVEGKISSELVVEYEGEGRTKTSMEEKDVIDNLTLHKTTLSEFQATYGQALSESPDGQDRLGLYTKMEYAFGHAVFLDKENGNEPVLAELYIKSPTFSAPRSTKVGTRMEDVLAAYRDVGGEASAKGVRLLYSLNTGRLGMLTQLDENSYQISYYCKLDNGQHIELSYFSVDGLIEHIEWLRYE